MGQHDLAFTQQNGVWILETAGAARRNLAQPGEAAADGTPP
jgi:hypothetical protein